VLYGRGDQRQHQIAALMTMLVIDRLEEIYIEKLTG